MTLRALRISIVVLAVLALGTASFAHEGHEHKIMGTVAVSHENHLEVKGTDGKTSTITLNDKTRILRGTSAVKASDIKAAERIVVTAVETKGKDGKMTLLAKQVNLTVVPKAGK